MKRDENALNMILKIQINNARKFLIIINIIYLLDFLNNIPKNYKNAILKIFITFKH